ncbi:MAG TPA: vWA domain-containing protein [Pyrinomonadaceae bacterium]|nr:vWA domain-containing protein [Pyrinomonadaceae bacterium]
MRPSYKILFALALTLVCLATRAGGQAGRRPSTSSSERDMYVNVFASRADGSPDPVTVKDISLYDGGVEQTIKTLSPDPGPARIVLLVDNSVGVRADVERLQQATREFAYEIYEGDQLLVVGYDEQAEVVNDWTDDARKIEAALPTFRKKGEPHLFDALTAVINEGLRPFAGSNRKRVVVIIGDGLDRGSKTKFEDILGELQKQDITVYAVQINDRTGGALRRDRPKPSLALQYLSEGTGGRVFPIKESREAAKAICDELRKHRYILGYTPTSYGLTEARRLLVLANEGINVRSKTMIR